MQSLRFLTRVAPLVKEFNSDAKKEKEQQLK